MRYKILLATKNRLIGDALQSILDGRGYHVRLQNENLIELDQQLNGEGPEIIIFGEKTVKIFSEELSRSLSTVDPKPKLAFLLSSKNAGFVIKGLRKGIDGFIHKESGLTDLIKCIKALKDDCTYISPSLSGKINIKKAEKANPGREVTLTCREEEIIHLLKENKTSREIGEVLNLSTKTIQNHRQNICNKLGLKGRNKLYEYAVAHF